MSYGCVKPLIEAGADVNAAGRYGRTLLMGAIPGNHLHCCDLLTQSGTDVNATDNNGRTALHFAAMEGRTEVTERLLSAGADVNIPDQDGFTALIHTVMRSNLRVLSDGKPVSSLIMAGADVNYVTRRGITALIAAAAKGNENYVKILFEAGTVVKPDYEGLDIFPCSRTITLNHVDISFYHFGTSFDLSLCAAIRLGNINCLKVLIQAEEDVNRTGGDVNRTKSNGNNDTTLMIASNNGQSKCLDALIQAGGDVNLTNSIGYSALHFACTNRHINCVDLLLNAGADVNALTHDGNTVLTIISRHNDRFRNYSNASKSRSSCEQDQ